MVAVVVVLGGEADPAEHLQCPLAGAATVASGEGLEDLVVSGWRGSVEGDDLRGRPSRRRRSRCGPRRGGGALLGTWARGSPNCSRGLGVLDGERHCRLGGAEDLERERERDRARRSGLARRWPRLSSSRRRRRRRPRPRGARAGRPPGTSKGAELDGIGRRRATTPRPGRSTRSERSPISPKTTWTRRVADERRGTAAATVPGVTAVPSRYGCASSSPSAGELASARP